MISELLYILVVSLWIALIVVSAIAAVLYLLDRREMRRDLLRASLHGWDMSGAFEDRIRDLRERNCAVQRGLALSGYRKRPDGSEGTNDA